MIKTNNQRIIILFILIIILALSILSSVFRVRARINKRRKVAMRTTTDRQGEKTLPTPADIEKTFASIKKFKDPFVLGGPLKEEKESKFGEDVFKLSAILWDETQPMAIVNSQVVEVGSEVDGAKIISIEESKIKLSSDNQIIELKLETLENKNVLFK